MSRAEAFESLGAGKIGRSQWHKTADDGVEVVSIWDHALSGDRAESHVHGKHFSRFQPGTQVRAVLQKGYRDPESGSMKCTEARPDPHEWIIDRVEVREIEERRRLLHVLHLKR